MKRLLSLILLIYFLLGCKEEKKLRVITSVNPQKIILRDVFEDDILVSSLISYSRFPTYFKIEKDNIDLVLQADYYVTMNAPFEKHLIEQVKLINPRITVINSGEGINLREFLSDEEAYKKIGKTIEKGNSLLTYDEHSPNKLIIDYYKAAEYDDYIWMNPKIFKNIMNQAINNLMPYKKGFHFKYKSNLKRINQQFDELYANLSKTFSNNKINFFYTLDLAFGYLADEFGAVQLPIRIKALSPDIIEYSGIMRTLITSKSKMFLYTNQVTSSMRDKIQEHTGCAVVKLNPYDDDYFGQFNDLINRVNSLHKSSE